ncbi:MAG: Resolvase domain protein [Candidatus Nomurabacteria bacterium GW2011_GWF2_40_31]|uniref:Resolvase domain protein n=2 Tax=Candidatus Nomuraibacteriota TaxID=1752729 RepID=A0A837HSH2_9BACT|nr:MAG: Resolvase domain protein [Candidatus Nomurabacteria bacterium GW2011_GWD2_39_12]KKR20721.1 MAG: Resolvase domain protein [Candidatus Nomurabacteria bacterium GW2011_GWC2_39_41]KKR37351.1 MAG: Resolvase domain protein [Candidatus Nomurabacteria bacterium GW2011_GWE2_40_10]KKR38598.1 MAG: Resolvase domain protein [Candidatus Nomurabacteria bacterium GW2011_GWB1_40_11]KKR40323.1 MAG: Resolvase domain protein [Parcubacteria group bacterium GW2011_GWC1_40_11]KKR59568.1 MAG: Resolvase domain
METETKNKIRVALYLRVSTGEQISGYGLEVQKEKLLAFVQSQDYSLEEKHIYSEEGFSGTLPVDSRPQLKQLFTDAQNKEFDVVLVYRLDRFFRKTTLLLGAIELLGNYNVGFRSTTEAFDTTSSTGKFMTTLLGAVAEMERETIRERTSNGKLCAAKAGKWVTGVPPFGFKVDKKTKKLLLVPEEVKIVQKLFKWLIDERLSLNELERRMNQMKIPTPYFTKVKKRTTNNYWYKRTIGRILTNEVYTGVFYYRKYKRPFNNLTSITDKNKLRPKEDWVQIETPVVISPETFELAKQQLMRNREFSKRNQKREYLYSKLIYCGKCNYKMFSGFQPPRKNWEHGNGRYYHGIYRKDDAVGTTKRCEWCPQYSEARLEPIWYCLKEILKNPQNMFHPLKQYIYKTENPKLTKIRLTEIETESSSISEKRDRANELYVNGQISKKQYEMYVSQYKNDEQKLKDETIHLHQLSTTKKEKEEREVSLKKVYEQIKNRLENVSYEEKQKIVFLFIERITLYAKEDYVNVVFRFPSYTKTTNISLVNGVSQEQKESFPLILDLKTISETERRQQIIKLNPLMYFPKTFVL